MMASMEQGPGEKGKGGKFIKVTFEIHGNVDPATLAGLLENGKAIANVLMLMGKNDYGGAKKAAEQIGEPAERFGMLIAVVSQGSAGGWAKTDARAALGEAIALIKESAPNGLSRAAGLMAAGLAGMDAELLEPDEIGKVFADAISSAAGDKDAPPCNRFETLMDIADSLSGQSTGGLSNMELPGGLLSEAFSRAKECACQAPACANNAVPDYSEGAILLRRLAFKEVKLSFGINEIVKTYDEAIEFAGKIRNVQERAIFLNGLNADRVRAINGAPPVFPSFEN